MQLDVRDVARILQVPESKVYHWISEDHLPAQQVGGKYRFDRAELLEWATLRRMNLSAEALGGGNGNQALLSLVDALELGGVVHQLAAVDKRTALEAVVAKMALPTGFDQSSLVELFLAREQLGSTAIGEGIAIPHPRHPVILPVARPSLTICFLAQPIDFAAGDANQVHTLFVLVSPTIRIHLQMLARISRVLQDKPFREILRRQGSHAEILPAIAKVEESMDVKTDDAAGESS